MQPPSSMTHIDGAPERSEGTRFPSVRAVVLELHEPTRDALVERLSSLGLRPEAAANAAEVDTLVDVVGDPVRVLLLDEGQSGVSELVASYLERPDAGPVPILLGSLEPALVSGGEDIARLARPLRDGDLLEALRATLGEASRT